MNRGPLSGASVCIAQIVVGSRGNLSGDILTQEALITHPETKFLGIGNIWTLWRPEWEL